MAARVLKDFRAQIGLVAMGGLIVRVVAVMSWSRFYDPQGDQNFYWRQGQDLAQGYGFVYRNSVGERVATAVHPPLYSAYLGVVSLFGGTSHAWHRLASTLLGCAAVVVIGYVGRRLAGNRAGLIAAALAALYPNLWINDAMMLSESMYALMIALVFLASYRFRDDPSTRRAIELGAVVALAALTGAEAAFLFVLLVVPLVALMRDQVWKSRLVKGGIVMAAGVVVLAPWVIRNYVTFESHPITISNGSGFVVEISNCDQTYGLAPPTDGKGNPVPGESDDKFLGYWAQECDRSTGPNAIPWPPGDETVVGAAKQKIGVDYINDHKRLFPVVVARVGRIWDVWRPGQGYDFNRFFENRTDIAIGPDEHALRFSPVMVAMFMYYPMLLASFAALIVLWRRRITIIPFVAVFAMTTLTAAVSFGITRYRVGADVALTILAGVALDALWRRFRPSPVPADGSADAAPSDTGPDADGDLVGAVNEGVPA